MKKLILALSAGIFLFAGSGCSKDDKNNCAVTVANIAGTYKIQKVMYKLNASTAEVDYTSTVFEACDLDDLLILNSNGVYQYQPAGVECTPPNSGDTDTWSLSGNTITIEGEAGTVSSFDCSSLVVVFSDYDVAGDKATFTLKKQ
ncbi:MAG TPA: lipocalin family protein [Ferruginibacter sp.]|jgi:hypothetical protein|nr:lipocalin family protein [Ferruginibacter sp.]HRD44063.1 lipocalin family protein [Ferruginibacter sp.]